MRFGIGRQCLYEKENNMKKKTTQREIDKLIVESNKIERMAKL